MGFTSYLHTQGEGMGMAWCRSCSQNAHGKNVLAWASDAFRRIDVGRVRRSRSEGEPWATPTREMMELKNYELLEY
jgi:hypothetical protein